MSPADDAGQNFSARPPRAPREVLLPALLFIVVPVLFLLLNVARMLFSNSASSILLPVIFVLLGVQVAYGITRGSALARIGGFGVAGFGILLHAVIGISNAPWWVRLFSLCALGAYGVSVALLFARPAREYLNGGAR